LLTPCILVLDQKMNEAASALAREIGAKVCLESKAGETYILVEEEGLSFVSYLTKPHLKLHMDYKKGRIGYRLQQAQKEPIVKAFADVPKNEYIFDATMGLGEDSVRLASAGHHVIAAEKNPFIYVLVRDAVKRAEIENLKIEWGASEKLLQNLLKKPYAVYLDPMFGIEKSAKVKKEMQVLQLLTEANEGTEDLFTAAMVAASKKVVVKRAIEAPPISNLKHQSVSTKTIRFDIYRK
jgi:16S rRNA (guanine1516-N2)-methyltransferase